MTALLANWRYMRAQERRPGIHEILCIIGAFTDPTFYAGPLEVGHEAAEDALVNVVMQIGQDRYTNMSGVWPSRAAAVLEQKLDQATDDIEARVPWTPMSALHKAWLEISGQRHRQDPDTGGIDFYWIPSDMMLPEWLHRGIAEVGLGRALGEIDGEVSSATMSPEEDVILARAQAAVGKWLHHVERVDRLAEADAFKLAWQEDEWEEAKEAAGQRRIHGRSTSPELREYWKMVRRGITSVIRNRDGAGDADAERDPFARYRLWAPERALLRQDASEAFPPSELASMFVWDRAGQPAKLLTFTRQLGINIDVAQEERLLELREAVSL